MKKLFISLLLLIAIILSPLCTLALNEYTVTTIGKVTYTHQESNATKVSPTASTPTQSEFKLAHTFSVTNQSIYYYQADNKNIYITSCTAQSIEITSMKQVASNTVSSTKLLLNRENSLPKDFTPKNLTNINSKMVRLQSSGLKLVPSALNAFYSMLASAKKAGVTGFSINSAYRSLETQKLIFDSNLKVFLKTSKTYKEAYEKTRLLVALPGNSEHHTGLALDIFSVNGMHRSDFEGTKEQRWLNTNAQKFGFILRYPKDKTKQTQSTYESWHFRYVGIPLSYYMKENNLCLEEFYDKIWDNRVINNKKTIFMSIKSNQKIYIDSNLLSKVHLEYVNKDNMLLTLCVG